VSSAGAVLSLPIDAGVRAVTSYSIEGREVERGAEPTAGLQTASPGYFETIGIPILRGRGFAEADGASAPQVAIVSQVFAERFFPGQDPLGRRIGAGSPEDDDFNWMTIVGVAGSTRYDGLDGETRSEVYRPMAQAPWPYMSLVLRTSRDPAALAEPLRRTIKEIRADQPVERIVTLDEVLHDSLARRRFTLTLLALFAGLALLLAAVGLYGVMSFAVAQRTQEIGIRMAIGARAGHVARLVVGQGGRLIALGLAGGCAASLLLGGLLEGFLFQVTARDPLAFAVAAMTLVAASALATWVPLRRALGNDPITSLRAE
jgi:putative ABC transport system permease protein